MPRVARIVIPDCPHHVTQRGNNRQDVFFVPDDYHTYLAILREQSQRYGLDIHAYCLMTNHVHLAATPRSGESLAKAVGRTHWLYTQHVNHLHARTGHLWQNRFYSCALDRDHHWAAIRYVERNPVRSRLHRKAWLYAHSSAAAHVAKTGTATPLAVPAFADSDLQKTGRAARRRSPFPAADPASLLDLREWGRLWTGEQWVAELTRRDDAEFVERLRSQTGRGRPLNRDSFLSKVEKLLGRRVRPLPVGRPRKRRKGR